MSDRANDPSRDGRSYEAAGLPRGLSINPSTGVLSGVVCLGGGDPDLPRPDAVISDGVPLPPPDPATADGLNTVRGLPADSADGHRSWTANLPPGVCLDGDTDTNPDTPPPAPPPPPS